MEEDIYLIVKSIDLLTLDEAGELPRSIRDINKWWWLQSPGYDSKHIAFVYSEGSVEDSGAYPDSGRYAIRPALYIEGLDDLDLPSYTELDIFDLAWIYIGNNKALAKDYLWEGRFDKRSTDYVTSEIKQKLDAWLEEQKAEFNDD